MKDWTWVYNLIRRSQSKYPFYEGNFSYVDLESSRISKKIARSRVGWGGRAVEIRGNKTHFDRFENDLLKLGEVFDKYHGRQAFDKIKDDVLVCGVGFMAVAGDRLMPFTALEATGAYDWYDQNLRSGVAVFKEATKKLASGGLPTPPDSYIYYTREKTISVKKGTETVIPNPTGRPLIGLLTHKATTKQPFGRTVLTQPARDAMVDASRTRRQAMIASYHYNKKVDVILGVDSDTTVDTIEAQTGDILKVGTNENGNIPQIGEFAQHALAPFNDSILMAARDFCTATKLTLNNLTLGSNAPQSPEALEIIGDDLRDDIKAWQSELGEQIKYLAVTLWMLENRVSEITPDIQAKIDATTVAWLPIFRADVAKFGDGLTKIAQNAPEIGKQRSIWRNLGLTSEEIDQVVSTAGQTPTNPIV